MEKSIWRIIRRFSSHHKAHAADLDLDGKKRTIVELRDDLVQKALAGSLEGSVFLLSPLSPLAYARTAMRIFQKLSMRLTKEESEEKKEEGCGCS